MYSLTRACGKPLTSISILLSMAAVCARDTAPWPVGERAPEVGEEARPALQRSKETE